jgi:hypothetical protein
LSELLMACLVLKIVLMLYQFPTCLNFSETTFTYGIYREFRGFPSLHGRLLPLEFHRFGYFLLHIFLLISLTQPGVRCLYSYIYITALFI